MTPSNAPPQLVIDTNWVLDLSVFHDPRADMLRTAIETRAVQWLTTTAMLAEARRVLDYPALRRYLERDPSRRAAALAWMAQHAGVVDAAPRCGVTCRDPDDQGFLDLAIAHRALLLSKDHLVLACRRRLQAAGADISPVWPAQPPKTSHSSNNNFLTKMV